MKGPTASTLATITLTAVLSAWLAPSPVHAQGERPSIRISGGHVYIGGQHAGSLGARRDPHGLSRIIGGHLSRMGDPRASRFGPDRLRRGVHRPLRVPPRHRVHHRPHHRVLARPHHRALHRPHHHRALFGVGDFRGQRLVLILHHPLGSVAIVGQAAHRSAILSVGPIRELREREPVPRPPAPPPLDEAHCADVTVYLIASARQEMRVDIRSLGATDLEEFRAALERRLRSERGLVLRDVYGGGFTVPASLVRGIDVEACEPPPETDRTGP